MTKIEPATLHRFDDPRLAELSGPLVGARLVSARYAVPAGVRWENYSDLKHVHEVDMGVELLTEPGLVLGLSWSTPGREEGLSLSLDRISELTPNELIDLVEVGSQPEWSDVMGRLIEEVGVSFHVHADDSSIRPWAFWIRVSDGRSATIALGEVGDGVLRYMPDNMLVIFSEAVARRYVIPSSSQSAWGEVIRKITDSPQPTMWEMRMSTCGSKSMAASFVLERPIKIRDLGDDRNLVLELRAEELPEFLHLLLAIDYGIFERLSVTARERDVRVRITGGGPDKGRAVIRSDGRSWGVTLSRDELQYWCRFLMEVVLGVAEVDHVDLHDVESGALSLTLRVLAHL